MNTEEGFYIRSASIHMTNEEWGEYCRHTREDFGARIRTTFGKYTFNENDVCLNPDVLTIGVKGNNLVYARIKWCECGNGIWSFGIDYSTGSGGGGCGASYADKLGDGYGCGYATEKEAKLKACEKVLQSIRGGFDRKNCERLRQMVEDYMKTLQRSKVVQLELF